MIFDCAGTGPTLDHAFNMVRQFGQVMLVAVPWEPLPILPVDWMAREIKMQTTFGARTKDYEIALNLMEKGKISIGKMVSESDIITLEEIQDAFDELIKPSVQLQIVIKF